MRYLLNSKDGLYYESLPPGTCSIAAIGGIISFLGLDAGAGLGAAAGLGDVAAGVGGVADAVSAGALAGGADAAALGAGVGGALSGVAPAVAGVADAVGSGAGLGAAGLTAADSALGGSIPSDLLPGTTGASTAASPLATPASGVSGVLPGVSGAPAPVAGSGISAAGSAAPAGIASDPATTGLLGTDLTGGASTGVTGAAPSSGGSFSDWLSSMNPFGGGGGGASSGPSSVDFGSGPLGSFPAAGSATPGAAAATDSGGGGLFSGWGKTLTSPSTLLAGGGLLYDFMKQPTMPSVGSSIAPLQASAAQMGAQGTQLASYLQSGTLPPGVQQGINQASEEAKAAIRSRYAAMGGGAENSSAALTDIANVDTTAQTQGANIAMNLLSQGISESQLSAQLYTELLNATLQSDQALGSAIGAFSSAMVPRTVITQPAATA